MTTEAHLTAIATPDRRAHRDGPLAALYATSRDVEHVAVEDLEVEALRLLALAVGDHALPIEIRDRLTALQRRRAAAYAS